MTSQVANRLMGPMGGFFEIEHEERIAALREQMIHAQAVAAGLEMAWKRDIDKYLPILERKAGLIKGERYSMPPVTWERLESNYPRNEFIYNHVEGHTYGLPGFYFWPVNANGKKSKRGPFRFLSIEDICDKHGIRPLQDSRRNAP